MKIYSLSNVNLGSIKTLSQNTPKNNCPFKASEKQSSPTSSDSFKAKIDTFDKLADGFFLASIVTLDIQSELTKNKKIQDKICTICIVAALLSLVAKWVTQYQQKKAQNNVLNS